MWNVTGSDATPDRPNIRSSSMKRSVLTTFCPFSARSRAVRTFPARHTCWVPLTVYALRKLVTAWHAVKGTDESEGKGKSHKKYFCTQYISAQDILLWLSRRIKRARVPGEEKKGKSGFTANFPILFNLLLAPSEPHRAAVPLLLPDLTLCLSKRHQPPLCCCHTPSAFQV